MRRGEDVVLYVRRLEDRRVLTAGAPTAIDDAYYVQDALAPLTVSGQLGLLSNDVQNGGGPLQTPQGTFTTDLGGTLDLAADGSFTYVAPTGFGPYFVDGFAYTADNGVSSTNTAFVTFYAGEVPVDFDQPLLIPIFGVEYETPADFVQVDLASFSGASLTVFDPTGITFDFGFNGDSDISISGTAADINRALDTLQYTPPPMYVGLDSLEFFAQVDTGGPFPEQTSQSVEVFVYPPECGCGQPGEGEIFAQQDFYYVPPFQSNYFVSFDAGLLSNDFSDEELFFFAIEGTVTTDQGGTVEIYSDGTFFYTPPTGLGPNFVDSFVYFASDEIHLSNPGFVTLFVGEVPVPEDFSVPLTVFNVEFGTPSEMVIVDIAATQGGTLTLLDTFGITFLAGGNGSNSFTITGFYDDVNYALDTLVYTPALNYSGFDFVGFEVEFPDRGGTRITQGPLESPELPQPVPIHVLPIADAPLLAVAPQPVVYQPGVAAPVNINVALQDLDSSEIPGLVILDFVPPGVIPSVGQQLPNDPKVYLILPSDLPNLTFTIDAAAPANFNIVVVATSIETTKMPGVFGGPGGPLIPEQPDEPRFALTSTVLTFVRSGSEGLPPVGPPPKFPPPPPQMETVFLLGPLTVAPPAHPVHHHSEIEGPPQVQNTVAFVIEAFHDHGLGHHSSTVAAFAEDSIEISNDAASAEEKNNDQGSRFSETAGIYLRKLGSDSAQFVRLPEELSEDYVQFMDFLKTLPNGDYVVYFKRGGQPHAEAEVRQVVVRVRVVNHRLNPDPGEFKPAGEVAEPPVDPDAPNLPPTVIAPTLEERAELPAGEVEVSHAIAAGLAAVGGWSLHKGEKKSSARIDQLMEGFSSKFSWRLCRRTQKKRA